MHLHRLHSRYAEVPQDRKYHLYRSKFLANGTDPDAPPEGSGGLGGSGRSVGGGSSPSPGVAAMSVLHHAILYSVLQNETDGKVPVGQPYDCTRRLPITRGLPYLVASHKSMTSPSDQLWEAVDAALPLGKGYGRFVILEVHYDNVQGWAGLVDSTGFEVRGTGLLERNSRM